jgi:hypothetical protein
LALKYLPPHRLGCKLQLEFLVYVGGIIHQMVKWDRVAIIYLERGRDRNKKYLPFGSKYGDCPDE